MSAEEKRPDAQLLTETVSPNEAGEDSGGEESSYKVTMIRPPWARRHQGAMSRVNVKIARRTRI